MYRRSSSLTFSLVVAALFVLPALLAGCGSDDVGAREPTADAGSMRIEQLTVDEPLVPDVAALRLVVVNETGQADTLRSVTSEVASSVSIHESETVDGMATMIERPSVALPVGATVTFAPGGLHVMLEDLQRTLVDGDTFPVTFHFDRAGEVEATATVVPLGSVTADDLEHDHG